uniref:Putative salp15 n=1 Tax=Ixodes ricinus TaxID=34613 RepID=A0A0K8RLK6_IXORI
MPKSGRSFSMTASLKMIAVLLLLFVHSLEITSAGDPPISGDFRSLAPQCEQKVKEYIKEKIDGLLQATVELRKCEFSYTRKTPSGEIYAGTYALPEGLPCAFDSTCEWGACKCSACP